MREQLTGAALLDLVLAIEAQVGIRMAGDTPLGIAIINLCDLAIDLDPEAKKLSHEGSA